ncbi:MAG TPA: DUF6687 family protein [Pyrinomonadaceae bacterium]|nr:DUF6687 family protein [Pyrinomonadaceae bacterium]
MRFEFYHPGLDDTPKLSVDGTVDNSLHFSHWHGNETPVELKADTSTEIALKLMASPRRADFTSGIELVTNNHFDTDGVLSVWTVLNGERALELRDRLIPAAEAGDFSEINSEAGVKASIVIQGSDQPVPGESSISPLASHIAGTNVEDEASSYELVLPEVEGVLTKTNEYEHLWSEPWKKLETALDSFARGASTVNEFRDANLSLVNLAPGVFGPTGFDPALHSAPATAISQHAHGRLFLITTPYQRGWSYRIDYPYYSWAETVVRPRIPRHDFSDLLLRLNQAEGHTENRWKSDSSELASAIKFVSSDTRLAASRLPPDDVANLIRQELAAEASGS